MIILAVIAVAIIGAFAYKPSREMITIKLGGLFKGSTTPAQKARLKYDQAKAKLPEIRIRVTKTMAQAQMAKRDVEARAADIEKLKAELKRANSVGANADVLSGIGKDYAKSKAALEGAQGRYTESAQASKEAQDSLQEICDQLEEAGAKIEGMEADHELAAVLQENAKFRQESADMHSSLSDLGASMRDGKRELEEARAANQLSQGSSTDLERAKIARDSSAADGLAELQALIGNKPAEATVPASGASELLSSNAKA
jgi:DNA-directed RNA polymerase alpha subunit